MGMVIQWRVTERVYQSQHIVKRAQIIQVKWED